MKKMPSVLVSRTVTPTAQEMQLKGSSLRIHTCLNCLAYLFKDFSLHLGVNVVNGVIAYFGKINN